MTIKAQDLRDFVKEIHQTEISMRQLRPMIEERWGISDYIVAERIKYLKMLGLLKETQTLTVFEVCNGSDEDAGTD